MHLDAYLRSAQAILENYSGEQPFALWLKDFFRQHKKYGSKDRKWIADLCFCFFRLGHSFAALSVEERLLVGQFLCHDESIFIRERKPQWHQHQSLPVKAKIDFLNPAEGASIFPFASELSPDVDLDSFQLSFLQQPDLFLRIRPGKEKAVLQKLSTAGIPFEQEETCLRLPINTKVESIIRLDEEAVVQDISSQKVLSQLQQHQPPNAKPQLACWDCCAASGGKTILLHDAYPSAALIVSDIRESILINLRKRLKQAGIERYRSFVADVASPTFSLRESFALVLCDAPCSGSGTWGRTPEQLRFFRKEQIDHYSSLQKRIAQNASRSVKKGGYFLYITCSVFYRENEEVVSFLQQHSDLALVSKNYHKGYDKKGDTLFAALFTVL